MKEKLRVTSLKISKKLRNDKLIDTFSPYYYKYAQEHIRCECPACFCPYQRTLKYSFVYIDEKEKLMYFDVPKCASSSIREAFFHDNHSLSMKNPEQPLEQYFKFTFVRNPWDRMVSNWKMFTTQPFRVKQLKSMTDKDLTNFSDFVDFAAHTKNHHWQPQVLYLPEDLDFVGRLETFDEDFNRLLDAIGKKNIQAEHLNQTVKKSYREYYTPSLVDFVAEMYLEDISRFGYRFEEH
jgi:hypothetical protein